MIIIMLRVVNGIGDLIMAMNPWRSTRTKTEEERERFAAMRQRIAKIDEEIERITAAIDKTDDQCRALTTVKNELEAELALGDE